MRCLKNSGWPLLDVDELVTDTNFDIVSVRTELAAMVAQGTVDEVNRDGNVPRRTKDGRPTDHVYYRPARPAKSTPGGGVSPALSGTEVL